MKFTANLKVKAFQNKNSCIASIVIQLLHQQCVLICFNVSLHHYKTLTTVLSQGSYVANHSLVNICFQCDLYHLYRDCLESWGLTISKVKVTLSIHVFCVHKQYEAVQWTYETICRPSLTVTYLSQLFVGTYIVQQHHAIQQLHQWVSTWHLSVRITNFF